MANLLKRCIAASIALVALALFGLGCEAPDGGREPTIDLKQRDVTWPTLDGEFERRSEPLVPAEEEEETP